MLREKLCVAFGRDENPSVSIIDSKTAKTLHHVDKQCGIDGNKKIKDWNELLLTYTLGLLLAIFVLEANIYDRDVVELAVKKIAHKFPRLKKILAAGSYRTEELKKTVRRTIGCQHEIVPLPDESPKKFNVVPLRWIVERSFAWLYNFMGIALYYEFYSESSETMIQIALLKIMLNKLSN